MNTWEVAPFFGAELSRWIETKHYARRIPIITKSFGLFHDSILHGIVTFAPPSSPQVARSVVCESLRGSVIELNRLVIDSNDKCAGSRLVGGALSLLHQPSLVVSYADEGVGHIGYIYQATNWLYCGTATAHDSEYLLDGKKLHPRTLASEGITDPKRWAAEHGITVIKPKPKHRYVFFCGKKAQKKAMRDGLLWKIESSYPKGTTMRHEHSPNSLRNIQSELFA